MQFFYDFFPVVLFFVSYKFWGIFVATAVAMAASLIQISIYWFKHRSYEKLQLLTLIIIMLSGGATLILHNPLFIKWKPTLIEWVFALIFLGSQFVLGKPLIRHIMEKKITLPDVVWNRLNISWGLFFLVMGGINIYVLYHYSTNTWVNFKLFGIMGATLVFSVLQAFYLSRYLVEPKRTN